MKGLLNEFKTFAFSGNLIDIAIGIAIGAAFATVVDTFVSKVILQIVGAIFGQPNFDSITFPLNGKHIHIGSFLTALVSFLLLALVLLFIVKAIKQATGKEAAGAQGNRECDHCKSFVPVDATVCMFCTRDIVPHVTG